MAQLCLVDGGPGPRHHERLQAYVVLLRPDGHADRLVDLGQGEERRLDLPRLDPVAADLDHVVAPSGERVGARSVGPDDVSGPVDLRGFGGRARGSPVAEHHRVAADREFALGARCVRHDTAVRVEQGGGRVRAGGADGGRCDAVGCQVGVGDPVEGADVGLGRPVEVVQLRAGERAAQSPEVFERERLAREQHRPQPAGGEFAAVARVEHPHQRARHRVPDADLLGHHEPVQRHAEGLVVLGDEDETGSGGRRREEVEDRQVEVDGCVGGEPVLGGNAELRDSPVDEGAGVAVGEHDALGDAGGTGGVDDVGQVARGHGGGPEPCGNGPQGRPGPAEAREDGGGRRGGVRGVPVHGVRGVLGGFAVDDFDEPYGGRPVPRARPVPVRPPCVRREQVEAAAVRDEAGHRAVLEDVRGTVRRHRRIDRHVRGAALEHGVDGHDGLHRLAQPQPDPVAAHHARLAHGGGEGAAGAVETGVVEGAAAQSDRLARGVLGHRARQGVNERRTPLTPGPPWRPAAAAAACGVPWP